MQRFLRLRVQKMQKLTKIVSVLVGMMFLVSAYAKAADAAYFSNLLTFYGSDWFGWLAPAVIGAELVLGLMLLLRIRTRMAAWLSVAFVGIITLGYAYGVAVHGVYNCGCFGHIEVLNLPPAWTFVRNAVLCAILVFVALKGDNEPSTAVARVIAAAGLMIGAFTVGYTFYNSTVVIKGMRSLVPRPVSETALEKYVEDMSKDSCYLVFCFSYNCPYCNQSIGNAKLFEETGTVDRVIGLAVADSAAEAAFRAFYKEPPFEIRNMSVEAMVEMTDNALPTAFLIRHDTIFVTTGRELFSPRFVKGFNPNNNYY